MKIKDTFYIVIIALSLLVTWLFIDKHNRTVKTAGIIKMLRKENQ